MKMFTAYGTYPVGLRPYRRRGYRQVLQLAVQREFDKEILEYQEAEIKRLEELLIYGDGDREPVGFLFGKSPIK